MFKNILVPTDLTEKSLVALDIALKINTESDLKITLLHVIETLEEAEDEDFREFYEKLEKRAWKKLDEMAQRYGKEGLKIHREIVFGNRAQEIVTFAREKEIDLIVLNSHKIAEVDAAKGWATISYKVGILSHCPVMMVK